jgi:hypothetical protein
VALRSVIYHHVSATPGRKIRDEQNSLRLAEKWRNELECLAYRRWCWDYLRINWTSAHDASDHAAARAALQYALHLRTTPPAIAIEGMHASMDREFARWRAILP